MKRLTVYLLLICYGPIWAYAGGIQLHLSGHRQLGMGNTGTGLALDAATIFFNPAGLSFIRKRDIQLGAGMVMPRTRLQIKTPSPYLARMDSSLLYTPVYFYLSWRKKNSKFSWGIGLNSPFWFQTKWEDNWRGRFISQEAGVTTFFIQPTVSYRFSPKFSLGVGAVYGFGNTYSRKALDVSIPGESEAVGSTELSGTGDGLGLNIGIYFQPNDTFSLGISWRSGVDMLIASGEAKFEVPPSLQQLYPQTSFSRQLQLPSTWNLGWAYRPKENLVLAFDISLTQWKAVDSIYIDYDENTPLLKDMKIARNYKNAMAFRFGGEYIVNELVRLRGGLSYDATPVQDNYVSPELPDSDKIGLTAGASFVIAKPLMVDLAAQYIFTDGRTAILQEAEFGGEYRSNVVIVGLSIRYSY